jgi:hypothetical protein
VLEGSDDVWKGLTLGGVAYVALQQFRLGRSNSTCSKSDLGLRQYSEALVIILSEANVTLAQLFAYSATVSEARVLFNADITEYLDEIDKKALRLHFTRPNGRGLDPSKRLSLWLRAYEMG